jgi:hypothetical protein
MQLVPRALSTAIVTPGHFFSQAAVRTLSTVLLVAVLGAPAWAQSVGATLQGTINDQQGAILPGATVVARNVETSWTRDQVTDERGWFRLAALPPGRYELRVELAGFGTQVRSGLTLTTGQEATINVTLLVATIAESVTVTGDSPIVD